MSGSEIVRDVFTWLAQLWVEICTIAQALADRVPAPPTTVPLPAWVRDCPQPLFVAWMEA